MPMTRTTRPRPLHRLVARVRRTKLRMSGVYISRGGGLMVEWQCTLSRDNKFSASLSRLRPSRANKVVTTRITQCAQSARGATKAHSREL